MQTLSGESDSAATTAVADDPVKVVETLGKDGEAGCLYIYLSFSASLFCRDGEQCGKWRLGGGGG